MILTKTIKMKTVGYSNHYRNLGYTIKNKNDIIEIKVNDLTKYN